MRFIFATWPSVDYQAVVLTHEGAKDRLISYAFTKELPDGFMQEYVNKGFGPEKKGKKNGYRKKSSSNNNNKV